MALDLSHVTQVVQDTLRAADEYSLHDPELAAALSLRAYEICREFDIDVASLEAEEGPAPRFRFAETASTTGVEHSADRGQADKDHHPVEDQDKLFHILDLQKTIVADQPSADDRPLGIESRSFWLGFRLSNPLIKAQPI